MFKIKLKNKIKNWFKKKYFVLIKKEWIINVQDLKNNSLVLIFKNDFAFVE